MFEYFYIKNKNKHNYYKLNCKKSLINIALLSIRTFSLASYFYIEYMKTLINHRLYLYSTLIIFNQHCLQKNQNKKIRIIEIF